MRSLVLTGLIDVILLRRLSHRVIVLSAHMLVLQTCMHDGTDGRMDIQTRCHAPLLALHVSVCLPVRVHACMHFCMCM